MIKLPLLRRTYRIPSRLEVIVVSFGIFVGIVVLVGLRVPTQKESGTVVTVGAAPSMGVTTKPTPSLTPRATIDETSESSELQDKYEVTRVVDGDTIKVNIQGTIETIRLIGVDTPETVDPRKPVECFGVEASKKMSELLYGQTVLLKDDPSQADKDKYKRLLRYVFLADGTHINKTLIAEGFAYEYTYDDPYKYQSEFKQAQQDAQRDKRGLWADGACDVPKTPKE